MADQSAKLKSVLQQINWMTTWRIAVFVTLAWIGWSASKLASSVDASSNHIAVQEVRWQN